MYGFIPLENRIVLPSEFRKIGFSNGIYILIKSVPLTKGGRGLFR